jgi:hypothetical protein
MIIGRGRVMIDAGMFLDQRGNTEAIKPRDQIPAPFSLLLYLINIHLFDDNYLKSTKPFSLRNTMNRAASSKSRMNI